MRQIKNDINEFEKRMAIFEAQNDEDIKDDCDIKEYFKNFDQENKRNNGKRNSLPPNFSPISRFRYYNINTIFDDGVIKEKPPVPPRRKKMEGDDRRLKPFAGQRRKLPKELLARFENYENFENPDPPPKFSEKTLEECGYEEVGQYNIGKTLEECGYETVDEVRAEVEKLKNDLTPEEIVETVELEISEDAINQGKPFPFPVEVNDDLEYEMQELLMMQRVTESSKERRKPSMDRRVSLNYTIHEEEVEEEKVNQKETITSQKPKDLGEC